MMKILIAVFTRTLFTQCRVKVLKDILKTGLLNFPEEIKELKHCTCSAPKHFLMVCYVLASQYAFLLTNQ